MLVKGYRHAGLPALGAYFPREVDVADQKPRIHLEVIPHPNVKMGEENLERVRAWFGSHLCGTQRECADALGLSVMAVNRHVKTIRAGWRDEA